MSISRRRWVAKKLARRAAALSAYNPLRSQKPARVRVLTYHRFGTATRDPFCVSARDFARQMRWVADRGLAVSLEQVCKYVAGEQELPPDAVLCTIDDGFLSTHDVALPILRDHAIPAVAFVIAGAVDDPEASRNEPERYMRWGELETLADSGVTIGSHAWTHRALGGLTAEQVRQEGARSRALLEKRLGQRVDSFAYPFGTRGDYSVETGQILGEVGYQTVFTSQHGSIRPGMDARTLPRIKVEGGEGIRQFAAMCRGGLDLWRVVDLALWRLQRVRREQAERPASNRA